jgi:hypothetical protein
MYRTNGRFAFAFVLGVIATVLALVIGIAAPTFSAGTRTALGAPAATPTVVAQPAADGAIPLKSIAGLTSLNATVTIDVNGMVNGKRTQGQLTALVSTNDQGKSQVTVSGSLLGPIVSQVGGSVVGLFTPSKVDIYKVPTGVYIVVNSLVPICIKAKTPDQVASLDDVSPQGLLTMLTNSDVARGKLVGDETRNGAAVKHYVINGQDFLTAAQNSSDPKLQAFGQALWSADDADLYVDAAGGYPVAYSGSFSGAYEPLGFEGDFSVTIEVTGVNQNTKINLPSSCNKPVSM